MKKSNSMDDFEKHIQRQSLRKIPGEWRAGILREGWRAAVPNNKRDADTASLPKWNWLGEIFWPNQKAWAALAAVWIFIFALNFSIRDKTPMVAEKVSPPSPEVVAELRQQKILFAELVGMNEPRDAEPRKLFLPRPRSERTEILTA
jgi:hypothetical protein